MNKKHISNLFGNNIVENSIGSFQKPIIPGDCPTFDEGTANYVRERLELYLKSWVFPKLDEVLWKNRNLSKSTTLLKKVLYLQWIRL